MGEVGRGRIDPRVSRVPPGNLVETYPWVNWTPSYELIITLTTENGLKCDDCDCLVFSIANIV